MLQPLGITVDAEAVYVALGPLDAASVSDLEQRTGLAGPRLAAALEELRDLGLAHGSAVGSWRALPLLDVVDQLRTERLSELERSRAAAESLAARLHAGGTSQSEGLTTLVGRDVVLTAHADLCRSARRELASFDKPPYAEAREDPTEAALRSTPEWQALERGVSHRCVYHPGFDEDRLQEMALFTARGEHARTAPVPTKLIVADAHVAMVPVMQSIAPGQELRATIVRNPVLVEALVFLFETIWDAAVPILTGFTGVPDARRSMLVSMLMAGSTDTAIAKSLDVNVRSVRRWVAELMAEHGVRTRLQLGAALVRSEANGPA